MDTTYKNNQSAPVIQETHAELLQASIQHEAQLYDDSHQQQVNLFDPQYNTLHHESQPHAPIDQTPHQHAPNHSVHEHSNPSNERRYLRDPDTGLWVNQVRSGR